MTFFIHRKIFSLSISQSKVHATKIAGVIIRRKRRCLPIAHTTYVACKEADTLVGSESSGGYIVTIASENVRATTNTWVESS